MNAILFIIPSPKTGGGNRVFIELANRLCDKYHVTIAYPNNSEDKHTFDLNPKVHILCIGAKANTKFGKILNIIRLIRHVNSNFCSATIIYTDPIFSIFGRFISANNTYRFIQVDDYCLYDDGVILGNGILLRIYKYLCRQSYNYNKVRFIFNSAYTYQRFITISHRTDVAYAIVHPALEHNVFNTDGHNYTAKQHINICLVARKHKWKGLQTFIDAFRLLPRQYADRIGEVNLISHDDLSGFDTSGMTIIRVSDDREMANIYRKSDIFVSPSWMEGFGLPPLEAMACGCACIISRSGGVDEFAVDNKNCLMFEPKDTGELLRSLETLIDNDNLRRQLSSEGTISTMAFSWEKSAVQLEQMLGLS